MSSRKAYPSDVTDEEWAFVAPYLTLMPEDAAAARAPLREVFNGLRYVVRTGGPWRWMPNDLPPWAAVYQQAQRWLAAGCFEAMAQDLRAVLRVAAGPGAGADGGGPRQPHAAVHARERRPGRLRRGQAARRARRCTWRWTRWATCWRCTSRPANEQDRGAGRGAGRGGAGGDRRDGRAGVRRPGLHRREAGRGGAARTASSWRSSSCPRPSAGSCCCRGAGWSSAASPGPRASAGWPATTSGCRRPSPASTSSPSPASCSARPRRSHGP